MGTNPQSTRREFLQGKAAGTALAHLAAEAAPLDCFPAADQDHYLVKLSRRAMACEFEIFLNAGQYPHATEVALATLDLVDRLEDQLSVYRPDSEISRLNRLAFDEPVPVEPRLFALLEQALAVHAETGGAYDITSSPLSAVWGFTRRAGSIPDAATLAAAQARVGSQFVELDPDQQTIRFRIPGIEINLGSIGKGYALDRCAELLETSGIHDFLLHGGHSSVLARGADSAIAPHQGWLVGVRDPLRIERRAGQLRLHERALATSGSGTQFFMHQGRRLSHILDPRTGWPAEGVLSVSVVAPSAAVADALSTAMFVMGPQQAESYCAAHPQIAAVMFCAGARAGNAEQHLFGLGEGQWSSEPKF
ncbi:MAG TPA: FAD:protein FMN transferase [Pirellulales bacterium]|jgi:thiamine biosynthesis lipoprotein|nr:FAD:protein FMN transferase [Pirellulales bacterium]